MKNSHKMFKNCSIHGKNCKISGPLKLSKITTIYTIVVSKKMRDAEMESVFLSKITLMTMLANSDQRLIVFQ